MINNYDKIAGYYDMLSRAVFRQSQVVAQVNQLKFIRENATILIVGGGTGWILAKISKIYPAGLNITYVEISSKMLALSRKRNYGNNQVEFINIGIEEFTALPNFDVILTPFLFDNFSRQRAEMVFKKLDAMLNKSGYWLLTDFTTQGKNANWWKKIFLKLMYAFFKTVSNVEAKTLVDIYPFFYKSGYTILDERFYYGQFIKATVFKK